MPPVAISLRTLSVDDADGVRAFLLGVARRLALTSRDGLVAIAAVREAAGLAPERDWRWAIDRALLTLDERRELRLISRDAGLLRRGEAVGGVRETINGQSVLFTHVRVQK